MSFALYKCSRKYLLNPLELGLGDPDLYGDVSCTPNGQKLSQPEPTAQNNQKAHSQIGSANEGLAPALC